jgi:hypothetical protein
MTAEYAKIEMANKLLAIMKEYRKESWSKYRERN